MCGRFYLDVMQGELEDYFDLQPSLTTVTQSYNIAPSQEILAIVSSEHKRTLKRFRWGLIPGWAKDESFGYKCINARAETVASKPTFRAAFKTRRCLIPCSGFFEWRSEKGTRQPYCIRPTTQPMFALAGLFEHWKDRSGKQIDSCTIVVGDANSDVAPIHDRMPIILAPEDFNCWLDPKIQNNQRLSTLLKPLPVGEVAYYPVSQALNNPKNNHADLVKNISKSGQLKLI